MPSKRHFKRIHEIRVMEGNSNCSRQTRKTIVEVFRISCEDDVQEVHSRTSISTEDGSMDVLSAKVTMNSTLKSRYSRLSEALARADEKSHKCGRFYAN